jgi:hypothetical protein
MKKVFLVSLVTLVTLSLSSCGGGGNFVGTWIGSDEYSDYNITIYSDQSALLLAKYRYPNSGDWGKRECTVEYKSKSFANVNYSWIEVVYK